MVKLIVAANNKDVIGRDGKLPWHCQEDLNVFKTLTFGHPVIMGSKTWDSLEKPLKGRKNIIISRSYPRGYIGQSIVCGNLNEALFTARSAYTDVYIIGGGKIFKHALDEGVVDKIYLSRLDNNAGGDTFFTVPCDFKRDTIIRYNYFKLEIYSK